MLWLHAQQNHLSCDRVPDCVDFIFNTDLVIEGWMDLGCDHSSDILAIIIGLLIIM